MRKTLWHALLLGCVVSGDGSVKAQAPAGAADAAVQPQPGYVTGHVVCTDTQRPARVAQVRFLPLPTIAAGRGRTPPQSKLPNVSNEDFASSVSPVETDMDGNFTVRNLKPGRYIVRADLGGYLTPILSFSSAELEHPDGPTQQRMERELQIVDVHAQAETHVDVALQRGATVAGTVRYDDGSPAADIGTELLVKNAKGEWAEARLPGMRFGGTDGQGHYAIDSVPAGEYLVRANLSLNEHSLSVMPIPTGGAGEVHLEMTKTIFSLPVYSGGALRETEATLLKVESAATYDGQDITLPISKLHRVSGALVAGDGHQLNGGKVVLRRPDDHAEVASVDVSRDDRQFHFPYVPEGTYTLAVENPRDVTEIEVPNAPGVKPKTRLEERTVRRYGKTEQPLIVQSDVEGVLATVPEAGKDDAAAQKEASQ